MNISFQEVMMFDYFITVGTLIGFYSKALHLIRFLDVASELNSCFFLSSSVSSLCVFLNPEDKPNDVDEAGELLTCSCTLFFYARAFRLFFSSTLSTVWSSSLKFLYAFLWGVGCDKGTKNAKIYVSSMLTCLDELLSYRLKKEKGVLLTSKHFGDN